MKMSTRGQYALEIAVDLALHLMPDRLESLNDIAKRRNLSEKYLERIMKLLKEAGLVKSVRGAYGGYCLMKEPGEISVLEVLRAAEGQLAPVSCLVENVEWNAKSALRKVPGVRCGSRYWIRLQRLQLQILQRS